MLVLGLCDSELLESDTDGQLAFSAGDQQWQPPYFLYDSVTLFIAMYYLGTS